MRLIIEQRYPLGRFHATRWNQSPFEDAAGEWPPSPWRLLRSLAARWFQYSRESGDEDIATRNVLLRELGGSLPCYSLPANTWPGGVIKQYHPTEIAWTNKSQSVGAYRTPQATLIEDHYRAISPDAFVYWVWREINLTTEGRSLLEQLLDRTLYFGRAESYCEMRVVAALPVGVEVNCFLERLDDGFRTPVLASIPGKDVSLEAIFSSTDGPALKDRPIPPGTAWYFADIPEVLRPNQKLRIPRASGTNYLQFAVGGRVYPPVQNWVKVTDRFRGITLRLLSRLVSGRSNGGYESLTREQREQIALFSGKDADGKAIEGHRHPYFLLWPDDGGQPTRLIVWRRERIFTQLETDALFGASESPVHWKPRSDWPLRLVPLPNTTPLPEGFRSRGRIWESITPFVPPSGRRRFRENGRERPGETLQKSVSRMLIAADLAIPVVVEEIGDGFGWVRLHETRQERIASDSKTPLVRPGHRVRLEFSESVDGPLVLGDSAHFGLGLFRAAD